MSSQPAAESRTELRHCIIIVWLTLRCNPSVLSRGVSKGMLDDVEKFLANSTLNMSAIEELFETTSSP